MTFQATSEKPELQAADDTLEPVELLDRVRLSRLGDAEEAGLWIASVPWPRVKPQALALGGGDTSLFPLGRWPGTSFPRRLLMTACAEGIAPESLEWTSPPLKDTILTKSFKPLARMDLLAKSDDPAFTWERHFLTLEQGGRRLSLVMGLRTGGEIHWWEACRLVIREETPYCTVIEMAGAIPHKEMTSEEFATLSGYENPYLHKHNWLSGNIFARLHANGVCEVYARHVNNRFVDEGADFQDTVPVVGFRVREEVSGVEDGTWDGSVEGFSIDGVTFDVRESARLARPEQPGSMKTQDGILVWQPYAGVELYGGVCPEGRTGDPFVFHAEDKVFPRGMARTLRFSLNLTGGSPRIVRYQAPTWWYGVCGEILPEPLLPVSNEYDAALELSGKWLRTHSVQGGFEDGSVPRGVTMTRQAKGRPRNEPGWEGDVPYSQFLLAWRTGDAEDHAGALRSAYHFTDVVIDHAAKLARMHGYPPPALSLPMCRMPGTVAAYLETGDPYLLETAEAVVISAHWLHKNSWPRLAVGRDACYLRGAVMLYRYFGLDYFRRIAREGLQTLVDSQRPNGSFGDQGGGSGIHQWNGYITKPWMGLLALNPMLDYLELFPDDSVLKDCVKRFADWLMSERVVRDGSRVWVYQHDYNGKRRYFDPLSSKWVELPSPRPWHHESFARLLGWCAFTFHEPEYLDAWAESRAALETGLNGDHGVSAALQFLPWLQAKLWNAEPGPGGPVTRPSSFGPHTPRSARVLTPSGPVPVEMPEKAPVPDRSETRKPAAVE